MKDNKPAVIASVMLLMFFVASVWLVVQYVENEKQRGLNNWKDRITVLAESQKRSIENWLDEQAVDLNDVASNPLLQIYLSLGAQNEDEMSEIQRGQAGHLKNLIVATANRSGHEGIAVTDNSGAIMLATDGYPSDDVEITSAVSEAMQKGGVNIHGIYPVNGKQPRMMIVVPVSAVQALRGSKVFPGAVVAVINPELSLYRILAQNWLTTQTDETLLLKAGEKAAMYVSPLGADSEVFREALLSNESLAANFSMQDVGGFATKQDYRGVDVLVTSRAIDNTDWVMMQKIDANEALRESKAHQEFVLTVFLLAVFVVTISFIAIWRHSTSVRLQKARDKLAAQTELLIAVSDNIRDPIFLLDHKNHFVFVNQALASCAQESMEDIRGKLITHVFDADATESLLELRGNDDVVNEVMDLSIADCSATSHTTVVALKSGKYKACNLYVLHDITSLKEAQDRHNRLMEGIISTLVDVTDTHDPHCAHHSERTREVAVAVAREMGLSEARCEALAMASLLANIGKLYMPREILTKMDKLTTEEETMLRDATSRSVEILKGLEFDGPVIKFIEQKNEYLDGSGYPVGISGDAILKESRILSVSNAFVAMSSARAYRPGKPVKDVIDALLEQVDARYDKHVVTTLIHVAEGRPDWVSWQEVKD